MVLLVPHFDLVLDQPGFLAFRSSWRHHYRREPCLKLLDATDAVTLYSELLRKGRVSIALRLNLSDPGQIQRKDLCPSERLLGSRLIRANAVRVPRCVECK